jgi:hypothetical protein
MTAVQAYIQAIKNYKKIGGSIDDAIVIAETLLLDLEERQIKEIVEKSRETGLTAEYLIEQLKQTQ